MMSYSEEWNDTALSITISGDLSYKSCETFFPVLQKILMREVSEIIIDLKYLTHLDNAGKSLLELHKHLLLAKGGKFAIINVPPHVEVGFKVGG